MKFEQENAVMLRLRNALKRVSRRLMNWAEEATEKTEELPVRMAQVTSAIHARELAGDTTSLRQLHKVTQLSQPEALSLVNQLEQAGIVVIEENLSDAFESKIHLSGKARLRLAEIRSREAA